MSDLLSASWLVIAVTLGAVGCGDGWQPPPCGATAELTVMVTDDSSVTLEEYQVTVGTGGGFLTTYCGPAGNAESPGLRCTAGGVATAYPPGEVTLTVKSPGFHSHRAGPDPAGALVSGTCGTVHVALEALTQLEAVEGSSRSWFDAQSGAEDFQALGVTLPSEFGPATVVKFYIEDIHTAHPRVYFIDTARYQLHYDFVRGALGHRESRPEYDKNTYFGPSRTQMAGSIIYYPDLEVSSAMMGGLAERPYTVEFFPSDDLTPWHAAHAHRLLEERMLFVPLHGSAGRLFYLPATDLRDQELVAGAANLARVGAPWMHREELYGNIEVQLLNPGVGYGTLRLLTPEDLDSSPVSFQDIMLLTRLPNEVPLASGTITEELQTPLAHVNVAARARGTPNLALRNAAVHERVAPYLNKLVRFEVTAVDFSIREATLEEAQQYWQSRIPEEPTVVPFDLSRTGLLRFDDIGFEDSIAVGSKAANLAELHRLDPEVSPDGFAVPFFSYDQFMAEPRTTAGLCVQARLDCLAESRPDDVCRSAEALCSRWEGTGQSLFAYVDQLLEDGDVRAQTALREAALDGLRFLIHHIPVDAALGADLDALVTDIYGTATVRLRSSTNAEDLATFSGAGLYRSVAANGDSGAPSDLIRKVWASLWNWRAFEERALWNIDPRSVRMAVLVHVAFSDEAANGVLITRNLADLRVSGYYVNVQLGEVSVTNPDNGALPEIFTIFTRIGSFAIARQRFSSLSPGRPIMTDDETRQLFAAARAIADHFAVLYGTTTDELALDMEFKLHDVHSRRLVIKQVRPYFEH